MADEAEKGEALFDGDALIHSTTGCARCGGIHDSLRFQRFSGNRNPFYEFWALCPTNGQPILLRSILPNGEPFRYDNDDAANRSIEILSEESWQNKNP